MDRNEQYKHKQETVEGLRERRRQEGNVYVKVERMDECQHFEEDERRNEEDSDGDTRESDHEASASAGWEPGSHGGGTGSKEKVKCSFPGYKEQRLVEFFAVNPAFYDKSNEDYPNQQQKDKLLDQLAKELHTTRNQIQGWFKNMRTSVGKLYKSVSGRTNHANQMLTARKKWQLQNFTFLKPYIVPRTYTVPTTPQEEAVEQSQDEESQHSIPARPASPTSSTPAAAARKTKHPPRKKAKVDHLLMKYLDRSRPEDGRRKQIETIAAPPASLGPPAPLGPPQPDERTAFCQWMSVRMCGIPYERWDDFQIAAMRLMHEYSRPGPNQATPPATQHRTMPQAHHQWPQFQESPWQQHGGSQSHSVPPLLISSVSGNELADLFNTKQDESSEDE